MHIFPVFCSVDHHNSSFYKYMDGRVFQLSCDSSCKEDRQGRVPKWILNLLLSVYFHSLMRYTGKSLEVDVSRACCVRICRFLNHANPSYLDTSLFCTCTCRKWVDSFFPSFDEDFDSALVLSVSNQEQSHPWYSYFVTFCLFFLFDIKFRD